MEETMIAKPKYGFSKWDFPNVSLGISYIQDFPEEILKLCKDFLITNECQQLEINDETKCYILYLGYPVYVNVDGDIIKVYDDALEFIKEIVNDIEKNINEWADFCNFNDSKEYFEKTKAFLVEEINSIKNLISN